MAALLCPLCTQSRFDNLESLRVRLVTAATQNITCPICNEALLGLDKFTIHLFGHTLVQETTQVSSQQKEEIPDDPLCTVNMEDLNFLTSWEVCTKGDNFTDKKDRSVSGVPGKIQTNNMTVEVSQTETQIEGLNLNKIQNQGFSQNRRNTAPNLSHQQELHLEIHPKPIKNQRKTFHSSLQSLVTRDHYDISTEPLNEANIDFREESSESIPEAKPLDNITENKLIETSYSSPEVSSSFLSTLIEEDEPSNESSLNSSSMYLQRSSSMNTKTLEQSPNECRQGFEELENKVSPPQNLFASSPRRSSSDSSSENRELSEYMSELLRQKMPASNFLLSLPKSKKQLTCDLCGVKMESPKILAAHKELLHATPDPYPCRLCGRGFKMRGSLLVHTRVAHGSTGNESSGNATGEEVRNFHCPMCTKSFKKEQHLTQHMKTHDGKQWQCETCSKFFTTKYFLKKHQRLHTGEMPYSCETCKKTFTFQQSYHKHLLYHSADKPHECQECGRAFKELSTLHNHQRIHSGEKPFACETCGKCFRQRVSYIVHQRIHTGVLPYQCTACKKKFRYKVSQRSHKCTSQPPGVVVRQPGDLIQRILEQRQNILQCLE